MDLLGNVPAFVLAVLLISASPGPAMALILRRAALRGYRAAVPTVLGLELGLFCWALAAGGGFAALIAASETAYLVLRVVGALVLLYLGARSLYAAWQLRRGGHEQEDPLGVPPSGHARDGSRRWLRAFTEGLVVQLANPKAAVFMVAFYPQFVPVEGAMSATVLLGVLQVTIETTLYLALAAAVGRAAGWFRLPRIRRRIEAASGTVLVGLGLRVAASGR